MVLTLATYLGAIITIATFLVYCYKFMKKIDSIADDIKVIPEMKRNIVQLDDKVSEISDELKENSLETYKMVIMNDKIPLDERIKCGKKYIGLDGNGAIKRKVEELEELKYEQLEEKKTVSKVAFYSNYNRN